MEPDVSVVTTVKNDPRVARCIQEVLAQRTSFTFEVVVVDNASTDPIPRLLREGFESNPHVKLVASSGNLSEAWNRGAQSTDAPVLVRIDADMVPLDGWLAALAAPILNGRADWAAGPVAGMRPDATLVAAYYHHRTEAYCRRLATDPELRDAVPSWNVAYRRSALEQAGWYDPWQASSVDWDLHKRLSRAGARGVFVPMAKCLHDHPSTFREFARKESWYRTGQYQMALKYGFQEMLPAFLLPGAYALLVLLALLGFLWPISWWIVVVLLLALALKHWTAGLRERDPLWAYRAMFRPLEAFAGMYGFLRGIVRYGVRRRA